MVRTARCGASQFRADRGSTPRTGKPFCAYSSVDRALASYLRVGSARCPGFDPLFARLIFYVPMGKATANVPHLSSSLLFKTSKIHMRLPGIAPGSTPWEGAVLLLHHKRTCTKVGCFNWNAYIRFHGVVVSHQSNTLKVAGSKPAGIIKMSLSLLQS